MASSWLQTALSSALGSSGKPGWLGSAIDLAGLGLGAYSTYKQNKTADEISEEANPFGQYRQQYGDQLAKLMADPNEFSNDPAYKFALDQGLEGVTRKMAAGGFNQSGNMAAELFKYGSGFASTYRDKELDRLAGLAGANIAPASKTGAVGADSAAFDQLGDLLASAGYGMNKEGAGASTGDKVTDFLKKLGIGGGGAGALGAASITPEIAQAVVAADPSMAAAMAPYLGAGAAALGAGAISADAALAASLAPIGGEGAALAAAGYGGAAGAGAGAGAAGAAGGAGTAAATGGAMSLGASALAAAPVLAAAWIAMPYISDFLGGRDWRLANLEGMTPTDSYKNGKYQYFATEGSPFQFYSTPNTGPSSNEFRWTDPATGKTIEAGLVKTGSPKQHYEAFLKAAKKQGVTSNLPSFEEMNAAFTNFKNRFTKEKAKG